MKFSHSSLECYKLCGRKYQFKYIDKWRNDDVFSPLIFGSAFGNAVEELFKSKMKGFKSHPKQPLDVFKDYMNQFKDKDVQYLKSDFDELLGKTPFECLIRRGELMLEAVVKDIMPKIEEVFSTEEEIFLETSDEDCMTGFVDFELKFVDDPNRYTVDLKTSSAPYKVTDIHDKGQLLTYETYLENGFGSYIVLHKKVKWEKYKECLKCGEITRRAVRSCPVGGPKSKCGGEVETHFENPSIKFQILKDEIDEERKRLHLEEISVNLDKIENKVFPKNIKSCWAFGKKCEYYNLCTKNNSEGLYKKGEK